MSVLSNYPEFSVIKIEIVYFNSIKRLMPQGGCADLNSFVPVAFNVIKYIQIF